MNARWLAPRPTVELSRPLLPGPLPPKCGNGVNRKVVGSSPFSGAKSEFRPDNDSNA
jgi:hypothetical protein